jgi:hypothetical protein
MDPCASWQVVFMQASEMCAEVFGTGFKCAEIRKIIMYVFNVM